MCPALSMRSVSQWTSPAMIRACAFARLSTKPRSTRSISTRERVDGREPLMDGRFLAIVSRATMSCASGSSHQRLEIVYGPLKSLAQGNGRLPTQQLACQRNIRAALQGIVLGQRHLDEFRARPGHLDHDLGQLANRELTGIADVDRPGHIVRRVHQPD